MRNGTQRQRKRRKPTADAPAGSPTIRTPSKLLPLPMSLISVSKQTLQFAKAKLLTNLLSTKKMKTARSPCSVFYFLFLCGIRQIGRMQKRGFLNSSCMSRLHQPPRDVAGSSREPGSSGFVVVDAAIAITETTTAPTSTPAIQQLKEEREKETGKPTSTISYFIAILNRNSK